MAEPLLFVAASGEFILTGVSADPLNYVTTLAAELPEPIELVASWWVPAANRSKALLAMRKSLRHTHHRANWFKVSPAIAASALAIAASKHGGAPYEPETVRLADGLPSPNRQNRAVITPHGRFASSAAASVALGITRQAVWKNAHRKAPGWSFADE